MCSLVGTWAAQPVYKIARGLERDAIDKALVAREPLRNIAKRFAISATSLYRHKSHVAGAIARAQDR